MASTKQKDWESARAGVYRSRRSSVINRRHGTMFVATLGAATTVWWHYLHLHHAHPLPSRWMEFAFLLGAGLGLLLEAWPRERPKRVNAAALAARRGGMLVGFYVIHRWIRQGTHRRHESN